MGSGALRRQQRLGPHLHLRSFPGLESSRRQAEPASPSLAVLPFIPEPLGCTRPKHFAKNKPGITLPPINGSRHTKPTERGPRCDLAVSFFPLAFVLCVCAPAPPLRIAPPHTFLVPITEGGRWEVAGSIVRVPSSSDLRPVSIPSGKRREKRGVRGPEDIPRHPRLVFRPLPLNTESLD